MNKMRTCSSVNESYFDFDQFGSSKNQTTLVLNVSDSQKRTGSEEILVHESDYIRHTACF